MSQQPTPAPATQIAPAPVPQGTITKKRPRILIFNTNPGYLQGEISNCTALGYEAIGVQVALSEDATKIKQAPGAFPIVTSIEEVQKMIATKSPNIVMNTAIHRSGQGTPNSIIQLSRLVEAINDLVPESTPCIVNTVIGHSILHRDGKEGQSIDTRAINLEAYLQAQHAQLTAQNIAR